MARVLTPRRSTTKQDGVLRGSRLALPAGVASRYAHRLIALTRQMTQETAREIEKLYRHPDVKSYFDGFHETTVAFAMDISPAAQARILTNALKDKFEQLFGRHAKPEAERMTDEADAASARDVSVSLKELSNSLTLKPAALGMQGREFLSASIAQNVSLIKSIPEEYFTKVQGAVLRSITDGKGLEDLVPFFADQEGVEERRAKNIAIDQTHKAYNGLNRERMKSVGVREFEWIHSGGGIHPRVMHQDMNGKIYRFDRLPIIEENGERGIPGQAINCRCTMVPVVRFDDEPKDEGEDVE